MPVELHELPRALRLTARDFLAGVDLRARLGRTTWFRHRAALLAFGIDIGAHSHGNGPREPERCAADAWDWLDLTDLYRVVSLALDDAQRHQVRPVPDDEEPEGWHSREEFLETLAYLFGLRLAELARSRGLQGPHDAAAALAAWGAPAERGAAAGGGADR